MQRRSRSRSRKPSPNKRVAMALVRVACAHDDITDGLGIIDPQRGVSV